MFIAAHPYPSTSNVASTLSHSAQCPNKRSRHPSSSFLVRLVQQAHQRRPCQRVQQDDCFFRRSDLLEPFDDKRQDAPDISTSPRSTTTRRRSIPQLSWSGDKHEDATESVFESVSVETQTRDHHLDFTSSCDRCRQHISSNTFEETVIFVGKRAVPISTPTATFPVAARKTMALIASASIPVEPLSMATSKRATETRALMPADLPIRSPFPQPAHGVVALAPQPIALKKAPAKFAIGGSCSSSEKGMIVEMSKSGLMPPPKKSMFQVGGFSKLASTKRDIQPADSGISESAIDSDTDDDYVDESAIDDDDSSEWEDSAEESNKTSVDDKFFQRVKPKANVVSHPSLISLMVAQNELQKNLGDQKSHSASAIMRTRAGSNGPVWTASPENLEEDLWMIGGMCSSSLKPIIEVPGSSAQPIVESSRSVGIRADYSPRTTRRNMFATELTESLRCHLLWERQQKRLTANAVLKRGRTSHNIASLKQFPDGPCLKKSEDGNAISWNQYFNKVEFDDYHSTGW